MDTGSWSSQDPETRTRLNAKIRREAEQVALNLGLTPQALVFNSSVRESGHVVMIIELSGMAQTDPLLGEKLS